LSKVDETFKYRPEYNFLLDKKTKNIRKITIKTRKKISNIKKYRSFKKRPLSAVKKLLKFSLIILL